jgi:spore coat polysaccharide biosynthesis predicted glycosyltransferase SpsG
VLLGEGYQHSYQDLVDVSRKFDNHEVILAKTNRSMWRVMGNCALAILAGGLTTAEAVFAGLPTINIFEVEDHKNIMLDLINRGACIDGGLFSKSSIEKNVKLVEEMYVNRQILLKMRSLCNGIYDDKGGERILSSLHRLVKSKIDSNGLDKHYNPISFRTSQYIYGK